MIVRKVYRTVIPEGGVKEEINLEKCDPHSGKKITVSWGYDAV
jgi:hypothetical protein